MCNCQEKKETLNLHCDASSIRKAWQNENSRFCKWNYYSCRERSCGLTLQRVQWSPFRIGDKTKKCSNYSDSRNHSFCRKNFAVKTILGTATYLYILQTYTLRSVTRTRLKNFVVSSILCPPRQHCPYMELLSQAIISTNKTGNRLKKLTWKVLYLVCRTRCLKIIHLNLNIHLQDERGH